MSLFLIKFCLRRVTSNIYCVVFLFCFSCVTYVASFSGLSIFDCPFGILKRLFILCNLCCQFLWIVHFWLSLRYSKTFISNTIMPKCHVVRIDNLDHYLICMRPWWAFSPNLSPNLWLFLNDIILEKLIKFALH